MRRKYIALVTGLATLAATVVVGTAVAVTSHGPSIDASPIVLGKLANGVTPDGQPYELSEIRFPQFDDEMNRGLFCVQAAVPTGVRGGGCVTRPRDGEVGSAGGIMLGETLFVLALADKDVAALRVTRQDGHGVATARPSVDLGGQHLTYAVMRTPTDTLPNTDFGLPVAPAIIVEAVDRSGVALHQEALPARTGGTGKIEGHDASDGMHSLDAPAGGP